MSMRPSTSDAAEILRRRASGQSPKEIGDGLGIPEVLVAQVLQQVQLDLLPNRKVSPKHRLTESDQSRGGKASQLTRQLQRDKHADRISALIDTRIQSVSIASAYYWLRPGSDKEFMITLPNAEAGHLFYSALTTLGVPDGSIVLNWRCQTSLNEQREIQIKWGSLAPMIRFQSGGSSKSMRLSVSPFQSEDQNGIFKISSRGLALAFLKAGQQVVINASGQ